MPTFSDIPLPIEDRYLLFNIVAISKS